LEWQIYGLYYHDDYPGGGYAPAFDLALYFWHSLLDERATGLDFYTSDESSGFFMIDDLMNEEME